MARPVPNSLFLMDLARRVQKTQRKALETPTLLAAHPWLPFAVLCGTHDRDLHLFDLKGGQIMRGLTVPATNRHPTDFRRFQFSEDNRFACAYDSWEKSFVVWGLEDGTLKNHIKGFGVLQPTMAFPSPNMVAISDGPRISYHEIGAGLKVYTAISDDVRSMVFLPMQSRPGWLNVIAVFRKGKGGHSVNNFHVQDGRVVAAVEGPFRPRPKSATEDRTVRLHEIHRIPGLTGDYHVFIEEECLTAYDPLEEDVAADRYVTRVMAVNPMKCQFYPEELALDGQFCLEQVEDELHLVDEWGRRRRVVGFPLAAEIIDWRLEA